MRIDKMIIRLKNKTLMKGRTSDFSPESESINMQLLSGETVTLDIEKIKAVFFVKSFEGNNKFTYSYKDEISWAGHKVKIVFNDNEVMIGYTSDALESKHGFLVIPAELYGNNNNVFVVASAIREITYL